MIDVYRKSRSTILLMFFSVQIIVLHTDLQSTIPGNYYFDGLCLISRVYTRNLSQNASYFHRENGGTLGWYPSCSRPTRSPLEGDISNKYPLYKVYMGLIIKGTLSRVHHFPYDTFPLEVQC